EDALLSAYKKTPGAAKYARVEFDLEQGEFRVYELVVPEDVERELLEQIERDRPEPEIDPETGERREPEPVEIDVERLL
ncbi:hypothetical protein NL523_29145, partial [Klebsiella pneumoniae]|nr:hypothetical protein [Klebsiella pneumoniae]MCP6663816.1 hypothetical protein [Klebsiella pneumoniae]